jgi:hypothetical protein
MNKLILKRKRIFAGFLLVLFCGYMVSITCFSHSHIIDGQIVTHSHPYKGASDNPGHSHTAAQLVFIEMLSHFVSLEFAFACLFCVLSAKRIVRNLFRTFHYKQTQILPYSLRAPPFSKTA